MTERRSSPPAPEHFLTNTHNRDEVDKASKDFFGKVLDSLGFTLDDQEVGVEIYKPQDVVDKTGQTHPTDDQIRVLLVSNFPVAQIIERRSGDILSFYGSFLDEEAEKGLRKL